MPLIREYENDEFNAVDRILSIVSGTLPDRIPIFPMIDTKPAELLNLSVKQYYSKAKNVIAGQAKLQELLNLDYVSNFFYLAIESELFGMKSLFFEQGSPNAGQPIAKDLAFFKTMELPDLNESPLYQKTLSTTKGLVDQFKGKKPILSVQTAPFSLPAMLMGTSRWFESILMFPERIVEGIEFATKFAELWAKGHLEMGADIIVLVDGVGTATSIPKDLFEDHVIPIYQDLNKRIDAPIVFYTAGGDMLPFADVFHKTGAIGVFPSADDDLEEFIKRANNTYTVFGNLNNLELGDWPSQFMEEAIKKVINIGKPNGKFVLATQHMIPDTVPIDKIADLIRIALRYAYY
ncbi:MAG: putative Uroporphyrinogen decarboxylase (URO-D) [Promethearchaeota archaeon]|nr:MAG: putative Uroporphyrinogen decarboxylase (URO-D) [Candidatus Lokiarchaeota archaeon]